MKRFILALAAVAALLTGLNTVAVSGSRMGGIVTGNNSTDTTITKSGSIPGNNTSLLIWNPDAECTIVITHGPSVTGTVQLLLPVDPDPVVLDLGYVVSVAIDKTTNQRVGVFFIGD